MPARYFSLAKPKRTPLKHQQQQQQQIKRYLKFLSISHNPRVNKVILADAPDRVIKVISNAALNAQRGDVHLTPAQKRLFAQNRRLFDTLTSKRIPLNVKRRFLVRHQQQRGGGVILGTILAAVLTSLGRLLFK